MFDFSVKMLRQLVVSFVLLCLISLYPAKAIMPSPDKNGPIIIIFGDLDYADNNFSVCGNPSTSGIRFLANMDADDVHIAVYDANNTLIYEQEGSVVASNTIVIDTENWSEGTYQLHMTVGTEEQVLTVLVQ